jgi:hypothetical protein
MIGLATVPWTLAHLHIPWVDPNHAGDVQDCTEQPLYSSTQALDVTFSGWISSSPHSVHRDEAECKLLNHLRDRDRA